MCYKPLVISSNDSIFLLTRNERCSVNKRCLIRLPNNSSFHLWSRPDDVFGQFKLFGGKCFVFIRSDSPVVCEGGTEIPWVSVAQARRVYCNLAVCCFCTTMTPLATHDDAGTLPGRFLNCFQTAQQAPPL